MMKLIQNYFMKLFKNLTKFLKIFDKILKIFDEIKKKFLTILI